MVRRSHPVLGHPIEMMHQTEVGELDFKWMAEYGATWRISGELGVWNGFNKVPIAFLLTYRWQ